MTTGNPGRIKTRAWPDPAPHDPLELQKTVTIAANSCLSSSSLAHHSSIVKFGNVNVKALLVSSTDGTRRVTPHGGGVVGWSVADGGEGVVSGAVVVSRGAVVPGGVVVSGGSVVPGGVAVSVEAVVIGSPVGKGVVSGGVVIGTVGGTITG